MGMTGLLFCIVTLASFIFLKLIIDSISLMISSMLLIYPLLPAVCDAYFPVLNTSSPSDLPFEEKS